MCDDETKDYLRRIVAAVEAQEYEYAGPFTIGGATDDYMVSTPFNTECEYALIAASSGSSGSGKGSFTVTAYAKTGALANNGTDKFGPVSYGKEGNPLHGYAVQMGNNTSIPFTPVWLPINGNSTVYVTTSVDASTTIVVTLVFRRLLVRVIPVRDRKSPTSNHRLQPRYGQSPEGQIVPAGALEGLLEESREGRGVHGRPGTPIAATKRNGWF